MLCTDSFLPSMRFRHRAQQYAIAPFRRNTIPLSFPLLSLSECPEIKGRHENTNSPLNHLRLQTMYASHTLQPLQFHKTTFPEISNYIFPNTSASHNQCRRQIPTKKIKKGQRR